MLSDLIQALIAISVGYLAGSIPFGLLLAKAFGQGDIRQIGSGSIGATNVLRTGRKDLAVLTVLLDASKAGLAGIILMGMLAYPLGYVAAIAALVGHCYPVWLKFKGGKGVATFFGALFFLLWPIGLIAAAIWLTTAALTKYSSLSGMLASLGATLAAMIYDPLAAGPMVLIMTAVILWRHKDNIGRLRRGEESKIGQKG